MRQTRSYASCSLHPNKFYSLPVHMRTLAPASNTELYPLLSPSRGRLVLACLKQRVLDCFLNRSNNVIFSLCFLNQSPLHQLTVQKWILAPASSKSYTRCSLHRNHLHRLLVHRSTLAPASKGAVPAAHSFPCAFSPCLSDTTVFGYFV